VNIYKYNDSQAASKLSVKTFNEPNSEWLRFVVHNRRNGREDDNVDIIIGPVANDDVFEAITLYESGQIDEEATIRRLKVKRLFGQVLFCNDNALKLLEFQLAYTLAVPK
jgi:hypothetical protein